VNSVVLMLNIPSNMYIKKYYPTTAPIAKPSLRKRDCFQATGLKEDWIYCFYANTEICILSRI